MLRRITDEALQAELNKRKAERDKAALPVAIEEPDWSTVRTMAISHVESILCGEREDKDIEHYIYERVLEALYGPRIWGPINERLR